MTPLRARFLVTEIRHHHAWAGKTIVLEPLCDQTIPEGQRLMWATPEGRFEMSIDTPAANECLVLGAKVYIDIANVKDVDVP